MTDDTTPEDKLANAARPAGKAIDDLRDLLLIDHNFPVDAIDSSGRPTLQFNEVDSWQNHIKTVKNVAEKHGFKFLDIKKENGDLSRKTDKYQQLKFRHEDYRTFLHVKTFIHGEMIVDFTIDYKDKRGGEDNEE